MDAFCDHNSISIDEFDALSIEVRFSASPRRAPSRAAPYVDFEKYPAKAHAHKVKDQLGVESGLIYLPGQNAITWEDTDGSMPFRQRRYAFYLSGANFEGTAVTYDIGKDNLILWISVRKPEKIIWFGALPSIEECTSLYDVDSVRNIDGLKAYLEDTIIPHNVASSLPVFVLHKDQRPPSLSQDYPVDDTRLPTAMDFARAVKTDYEVKEIRKAVDISSAAHREVQRHIKSFKNEAQVENMFVSKCRELGAKKQAYAIIAGSGPNAAVLHYDVNNDDFGDRQLMVLDAGAEYNCYASDVTRTFPLNGTFTQEAKKVYAIVADMQESCIAAVRPGAKWSNISAMAREIALKGLLNIGILQPGNGGDSPPVAAVSAFFMHGLGHLVGLDTHDVIERVRIRGASSDCPGISPLKHLLGGKWQSWGTAAASGQCVEPASEPPLETNMVITVEPGIYFNRAYIEDFLSRSPTFNQYVNRTVLQKYYPVCGVRIEDCVLVTADGYENLTTAPKGEEMIKIINGD